MQQSASMASFGKLTNAFLQASQETTVAFANLNFDFSLIKYEAPKEFQGLGEALSTRRRAAAENGSVHVTARKLGALFGNATPAVPNLIRAYGLRASEVAKLPAVNPGETAPRGLFADHVGADGTSIWAAATSGTTSVTVHLLACLLARIWRREEAVPIWCELVEQRKALLQSMQPESDNAVRMSDLTASRIDISRSQLDEWDASARAWLQTADEAKRREQTQYRLLVDNISLAVSNKTTVHDAIIEAWTSAMKALDSLIQGAPHRIDSGAVLLGLSAWHLYPDIVLAGTGQYVRQGDPLISSGGIITLGLSNRDDSGRGIFWSLPLSLTRYYGDPIVATRHTGVKESQVTFDDLTFVVLGSIIGGWRASDLELDVCLDLIHTIANSQQEVSQFIRLNVNDEHWLNTLSAAAIEFSRSQDVTRLQLTKLINFGQRRCAAFLSNDKDRPAPVFGLTKLGALLEAFESDNSGMTISLLRKWAAMILSPQVLPFCTIRYFTRNRTASERPRYTRVYQQPDHRPNDNPFSTGFSKSDEEYDSRHPAMIPPAYGQNPEPHLYVCGLSGLAAVYMNKKCGEKALPARDRNALTITELIQLVQDDDITKFQIVKALDSIIAQDSKTGYFQSLNAFGAAKQLYSGLDGARVDLQVTSRTLSKARWWKKMTADFSRFLPVTLACIAYFETGGLDIDPDSIGSDTFALCHSNSIFVPAGLLADPSDAVKLKLKEDTSPKADAPPPEGADDASPHKLPWFFTPIQRITGNVGKPGLGFLVTPADPKMRKLDYGSWHMISHEPFDGSAQDNFQQTSLHLSFTGFELPLDAGSRGRRDVSGNFFEAAVSVHDRGEWVADVDMLAAASQWATLPQAVQQECQHSDAAKTTPPPGVGPLVSVDTWLELLDPPAQNAVLRAHKNPTARLAAAALATRRCRKTVVLPGAMCWACHGAVILSMLDSDKKLPSAASRLSESKARKAAAASMAPHTAAEQGYYNYDGDDEGDASIGGSRYYAFDMSPVTDENETETENEDEMRAGYYCCPY
ncbi:hypothetical protein B0T24DRAFT_675376 [Lasiosphaeria ovina]|uniref:Uncharacterized protein n=1 Tax=Lasiosphaeria ovina TaxID=92902 RepID=A0AAE0TSM0_9PEZI|nr:hypothetical protein B0T24DRAFT_675376 [Lasiosphaeria ovina]